jgi:hypothetical protein
MSTSAKDQQNQAREYVKLTQTNRVELAGLVVQKDEVKGKQRMKDNLPVLDHEQNPTFYPSRFNAKISFQGGELVTQLKEEQFREIKEGEMYLFKGRLGLVREFGEEKVSWVFNSVEEL